MELTTSGIIFMSIAYTSIFTLLIYSYYKILKKKKSTKLNNEDNDIKSH